MIGYAFVTGVVLLLWLVIDLSEEWFYCYGWLYICNRGGFIAMVGYTFVIRVVLLLWLVMHL